MLNPNARSSTEHLFSTANIWNMLFTTDWNNTHIDVEEALVVVAPSTNEDDDDDADDADGERVVDVNPGSCVMSGCSCNNVRNKSK